MKGQEDKDDDTAVVMISEQGAASVMALLRTRGYFQENVQPLQAKHVKSMEDCNVAASNNKLDDHNTTLLVETTTTGQFVTTRCLCETFQNQILPDVGRLTVAEAARQLHVDENTAGRIFRMAASNDPTLLLLLHDEEIVTRTWLKQKMDQLFANLLLQSDKDNCDNEKTTPMLVSDVARSVLKLPLDDQTVSILTENLPSTIQIKTLDSGSKVLVTRQYMKASQDSIVQTFGALEEPVQLSSICKQHQWQLSWVNEMVQQDPNILSKGELHGDTYVPTCFTHGQRQAVLEAFDRTGLVTEKQARAHGMPLQQMKDCIQENAGPSAIVLEQCVVDRQKVVAPLEAAVVEAISEGGWLNLPLYLPPELMQFEPDARAILEDHVFSSLQDDDDDNDSPGMLAIQSDGGLFFSQSMITETNQSLLPSLLENLAKTKAQELDNMRETTTMGGGHTHDDAPPLTGKEKRRAKKSSKHGAAAQQPAPQVESSLGSMMVSAKEIAQALVQKHPDLAEYQPSSDNNDVDNCALLSLCDAAFCTESHISQFRKYVQAELKVIQEAREATATASRKETASKVRGIEASFEDPACFAAGCYMISENYKFLKFVTEQATEDDDETVLTTFQEEFLEGCCADFTSRVTQYCLFKNAVDMDPFSFHLTEADGQSAPRLFYDPLDCATRHWAPTYFSCAEPDENQEKPREPLPLLRNALPGSVGVVLARQWILCGGKCYQGGVRQSSSTTDGAAAGPFVRPGDVEGFMAHVQENCLTICGLPFKKLDKKKEKQFLNARRQRLMSLLETENDAAGVLELTIMLLFQLFRNVVVSGSLLRGPILTLLTKERKMTETVAEELKSLAHCLDSGEPVDEALVERVRACGLNKRGGKSA